MVARLPARRARSLVLPSAVRSGVCPETVRCGAVAQAAVPHAVLLPCAAATCARRCACARSNLVVTTLSLLRTLLLFYSVLTRFAAGSSRSVSHTRQRRAAASLIKVHALHAHGSGTACADAARGFVGGAAAWCAGAATALLPVGAGALIAAGVAGFLLKKEATLRCCCDGSLIGNDASLS